MATIDLKKIIDQLIAGNGRIDPEDDAPDNPLVVRIVEYTNFEGAQTWGVVFEHEPFIQWMRYETPTEYVRNPRVIWRHSLYELLRHD